MEQIQNEMRDNQGKLLTKAKIRALERQAKMPQNLLSTELEPSTKRGGGMAGLARVVGKGKKRAESVDSMSSGEGGARHMGRMMFEHLSKLHGDKYAKKFMGGAAPRGLAPSGIEVSHALMSPAAMGLPGQALGGQDVPPGGMAPRAYGSAPQAPATFQRNTVALGSKGLLPSAQVGNGRKGTAHKAPSVHSTMNEMEGGVVVGGPKRGVYKGVAQTVAAPMAGGASHMEGGKRAARGAAISKLMKEKGMTLGQASKHIKEHGY
jgi:hypothetical protein